MNKFESYAYQSHLKKIRPTDKVSVLLLTLLVIVFFYHPIVSSTTLVIVILISLFIVRISLRDYLIVMSIPLSFIALSGIAIVIQITKEPSIYAIKLFSYYIGTSPDNLIQAINVVLTALASTNCMFLLIFTTPMIDVIDALRSWRLPTVFTTLMMMIYKFIFILLETAEKIHTAQSARLGYVNLMTSYRSIAQLVTSLFIQSIKRAYRVSDSLESRGYTGEIKVLNEKYLNSRLVLYFGFFINAILIAIGIYA